MSLLSAGRPIRVGILAEFPTLSGGEFSLLAALEALQGQVQPVVICPPQGPLAQAVDRLGCPRSSLPPTDFRSAAGKHEFSQALREIVSSHRLDLLHANSLTMGKRLGEVAAELECPTTAHLRDIMSLSRAAAAALNQHAGLVAVSQATRAAAIGQGIDSGRIETIYNGIDLERWRPRPRTGCLTRELGIPPGTRLAACIGQICLRKGQLDLAHAATQLQAEFPELHFILVGQRHSAKAESVAYDEAIDRVMAKAGIADRLHRLGIRTDIPDILREIDLLIHPARQEPLGRVLLEAAACAVPIVATHVGGTPEILSHALSGWLVPPGDPLALAEGIRYLLTDESRRIHTGHQARSAVEAQFSIRLAADRLGQFWRRAQA